MRISMIFACLISSMTGVAYAQDKVSSYTQTLTGTWIAQVADATGNVQLFEVGAFHPDGSYSGANVNASHTEHKGVWLRTGDRKFILTVMFFGHDEKLAFTSIIKAKIYITMAEDLKSYDSVAERTIMDPTGKVLSVTPGIAGRSVRMDVEFPMAAPPE